MVFADLLKQQKWLGLKKLRLTNLRVNHVVGRATDGEVSDLDVRLATVNLSAEEYSLAAASDRLSYYRAVPYVHRKLLEYLTSITLARPAIDRQIDAMCDFAGGQDPFALWAKETYAHAATVYAVDPLLCNASANGVVTVRGDARRIELPDESLDLITCHHSIEHFRENMDMTAVAEFARVLKKGGIAVITPVFIGTKYVELWNILRHPVHPYDSRAIQLTDLTSPFPGWGEFEHFARVYDPRAFEDRVLSTLRPHGTLELFEVTFNGAACPDLRHNSGLPALCHRMLSLRFTKAGQP